jgi:uncharacterized protein (DUF1697 family)
VALLRGINLGASRRVPMGELRERLHAAGYPGARTYLQSGNIVLDSDLGPGELAAELTARLEEWFGFAVPVVVRSGAELAAIVAENPLAALAENPKYYVVTFLDREPDPGAVARLAEQAREGEQLVHQGREIYVWHPGGQARSKLGLGLTAAKLGVLATARNWTTVTALAEMARA